MPTKTFAKTLPMILLFSLFFLTSCTSKADLDLARPVEANSKNDAMDNLEEPSDISQNDNSLTSAEEILPADNPESLLVLVNKYFYLEQDYVPQDLTVPNVSFSFEGYDPKKQLRQEAAVALEALFSDALNNEHKLYAVSGYRSYQRQAVIFENNVQKRGWEKAAQISAQPGHSEHQTGLAIDITSAAANYALVQCFAETDEGKWIADNAHRYGFIIRYPKGKENLTGYMYEPWHLRYVGIAEATYIKENNLILEDFLENHLDTIFVQGNSIDE